MSRLFRLTNRFLPTGTRLAWSRARIDKAYARDIAAAHKANDHEAVRGLEEARSFELSLQREEEDAHYTRGLVREARRLRVPIPHVQNDDGGESDDWYFGSQTARWCLTVAGIRSLRDEIRRERAARHESWARLVVWVSALTGIVGAITGLIAVLKAGPH